MFHSSDQKGLQNKKKWNIHFLWINIIKHLKWLYQVQNKLLFGSHDLLNSNKQSVPYHIKYLIIWVGHDFAKLRNPALDDFTLLSSIEPLDNMRETNKCQEDKSDTLYVTWWQPLCLATVIHHIASHYITEKSPVSNSHTVDRGWPRSLDITWLTGAPFLSCREGKLSCSHLLLNTAYWSRLPDSSASASET